MIEKSIQLGEPVSHRGVLVAPLFPRLTPAAAYVTLDEALPLGFRVTEVDEAGLVPELAVHNPLDRNVLLYDGEELIGAKQNRILNVTVLVAAGSKTAIPVSCVEEGRWSARSAAFGAASHAAHPELRRRKGERLSADPLARGIAQHEVWEAVRESAEQHGVVLADDGAGRHVPLARGRPRRAARRLPAPAGTVRRAARDRRRALPRLRVAAGRVRPPLPEAARRLPARRARPARRTSRATDSPSSSPRSTPRRAATAPRPGSARTCASPPRRCSARASSSTAS